MMTWHHSLLTPDQLRPPQNTRQDPTTDKAPTNLEQGPNLLFNASNGLFDPTLVGFDAASVRQKAELTPLHLAR